MTTNPSGTPVLELRGLTKRYGDNLANDRIDLQVMPGEVHCLCGENGAGKSTMMNMIYGLVEPTAGQILVDGREVEIAGPRSAIDLGIGMVHQHFMLIPVFTVAENIVLGDEPTSGRRLDLDAAYARVEQLSQQYGLQVDPRAKVGETTVGQQQRAEILKALFRQARVLILDEPTAVLTPQEIEELLAVIRRLRDEGVAIVMISHKLAEVLSIADRISILRRGRMITTVPAAGQTEQSLAELMVGREVSLRPDKDPAVPQRPVLRVHDLWVRDDRDLHAVKGATFQVHAGEIVALAGIDGNGQSELIDAIAGLRSPERGVVTIDGQLASGRTPREVGALGLGHIPEDRHRRGLVLDFTLEENLALHDFDGFAMSRLGVLDQAASRERADRLLHQFDVRGGGPEATADGLSGGNQQKVVIARELERDPKLLIAAQPTRGVDIGAIEQIHARLVAERDAGAAILLVSLEMEEVLGLADRVLVIFEGQIVAEYLGDQVDQQLLGLAMTGSLAQGRPVAGPGGPAVPVAPMIRSGGVV